MTPELSPRTDSERKDRRGEPSFFDAANTVEALHYARLPSDDIAWVADVLQEGFPGGAVWGNLRDIDKLDFATYDDTEKEIKSLIAQARQLWADAYKRGVDETTTELNDIITEKHGQIVVGQMGERVEAVGVDWDDTGTAQLVIYTNSGEIEGTVEKVYIDVSQLSPAEQRAVREYRATMEL